MHVLVWVMLLASALIAGACVACALVYRQTVAFSAAAFVSVFVALVALVATARPENSGLLLAAATLLLVAAAAAGYLLAASVSYSLAYRNDPNEEPPFVTGSGRLRIVLLACLDPERFSTHATARELEELRQSGVNVPGDAVWPALCLAERVRYRVLGGTSPARAQSMRFAQRLQTATEKRLGACSVSLAWCNGSNLAEKLLASSSASGARVIMPLDIAPTLDVEIALAEARAGSATGTSPIVESGLWADQGLPALIADRAIARMEAAAMPHGIVLVGHGVPVAHRERGSSRPEHETYVLQRTRAELLERGIAADHVRIAWQAWEDPDVTDAVRHLAVLGCASVLVVPACFPFDVLDTLVDLPRAAALARAEEGVAVTIQRGLGDEAEFAEWVSARLVERLQSERPAT